MKPPRKSDIYNLRLPDDLRQRLDIVAALDRRPTSKIVREALRRHVNERLQQLAADSSTT